jgi:AraC-like DNA-binding protein
MIGQASAFINASFVMGCFVMSMIFIALPLPENKQLRKYRNSLWFLAGAYLLMAILKVVVMKFHLDSTNLISNERITISSLQATLLTIALILLLNPGFNVVQYLKIQITPILVLNTLTLPALLVWGKPDVQNFDELVKNMFHPVLLIRETMILFYLGQLVYLTRLFFKQVELFKKEIDNFYADNIDRYLHWIKYCFYAMFSVGVSALFYCFSVSGTWDLGFTVAFTFFYFFYGIFFIQYPRVFVHIEPVIFPQPVITEKSRKSKLLVWDVLKAQIVQEKLFLQTGITVNDMSDRFRTNRTSFSAALNKHEGQNFNTFINQLRIEHAKQLLVEKPELTIAQIAEQCGYTEQSNFTRQFKLHCNQTPAVWAKSGKVAN